MYTIGENGLFNLICIRVEERQLIRCDVGYESSLGVNGVRFTRYRRRNRMPNKYWQWGINFQTPTSPSKFDEIRWNWVKTERGNVAKPFFRGPSVWRLPFGILKYTWGSYPRRASQGRMNSTRKRVKGECAGAAGGRTTLCGRVVGKLKWRCDARQVSWSRRFNCGLNVWKWVTFPLQWRETDPANLISHQPGQRPNSSSAARPQLLPVLLTQAVLTTVWIKANKPVHWRTNFHVRLTIPSIED